MAIYTSFELSLILKAKDFLSKNPDRDYEELVEEFISNNKSIDEMTVIDCVSEAHNQLSE